eukprot:scaffold14691_cov193-Alexandrium_tamarense.AAC.10
MNVKKTYTAEERADRRRRTSLLPQQRPIDDVPSRSRRASVEGKENDSDEAHPECVEFTTDINTSPDGDGMQPFYGTEYTEEEKIIKTKRGSLHVRHTLSNGQRVTVMRRMSSESTATETAKKRFSQFLDEAYEIDESTGRAVVNSVEEMQRKRWEKEMEEDSRNFDPNGTSTEERERNKTWAVQFAMQRAAAAGFVEQSTTDEDAPAEPYSNDIEKCDLPPIEQLPPLKDLGLDETSSKMRHLGMSPPPLPHEMADVVPIFARAKRRTGISDGMLVCGTLKEGWKACDSQKMIVLCVNNTPECGSYLRCSRKACLVRCPQCNTVSPAEPAVQNSETEVNGDLNDVAQSSPGRSLQGKASLTSKMTTVGWGG